MTAGKQSHIESVHDMSSEGFDKLAKEIMALGYSEEISYKWAAQIGDTPLIDPDGKIVVFDEHGKVAARLALTFFSEKQKPRKLKPNPNDPEFWFLYQAIKRHGVEDRKAARWSALVGLRGGPAIGDDGKFPVLDEKGRELARLPADILTKPPPPEPEIISLDGCPFAV